MSCESSYEVVSSNFSSDIRKPFRVILWNIDCEADIAIFRLVDVPPGKLTNILVIEDLHALPLDQGSEYKQRHQGIFGVGYPLSDYRLTSDEAQRDKATMTTAQQQLFDDAIIFKGISTTLHDFIKGQYVGNIIPGQKNDRELERVQTNV